jgi:GDP-4-dehydro-6-deoxy-D-mannose reductase
MDGEWKRALVTGATGFIGRHLVALLMREAYQVTALCEPEDPLRAALPAEVDCLAADVNDPVGVANALNTAQPDLLFHLAGLVGSNNLEQLLAINVLGTEHVLRAAGQLPRPPRVVIPGSAAAVGLAGHAIDEQAPLRPLSEYGVSKAAQIMLGQCYAWRGQVPVIIGNIFNITGPGEPPSMLCGAMAAQIAACEAGEQQPLLRVGNLAPTRDFLDVRDVVKGLWLLALHGRPGEVHNVCSGQEWRVEEVVRQLVAYSPLTITLVPDPERQRPSDVPRCVGVPNPLLRDAGWQPAVSLAQSLHDTLAWWRKAYREGPTYPIKYDSEPPTTGSDFGSQSKARVVI